VTDIVIAILAIALLFVGLPIALLRARDVILRRRRSPESLRAARRAYERRISEPDWACVSRQLQRRVPEALRDLYADVALVTSRDLRYSRDHSISSFEALDQQAIVDATSWLGFEALVLATTDGGDAIYLRAGSSEMDTLYLTYHDGGDTKVFAESVATMLRVLRPAHVQAD